MNLRITFFFLALLSSLAATAFASPEIIVDQPLFNFGSITEGTKVDHVFTFRNGGDSPLTILQVRPACGCTAATVSSSTIQPGKTGEIKATFDSKNFSGNMTKTIAVETNDPKKPTSTLTMKGTVATEVQVTPKSLNFGQVKSGVAQTLPVVLENHTNKTFSFTVSTPMPQAAVKAEKLQLKPRESTKIHVTVMPRSEDRILSGYVTIKTDIPGKGEIMIPVYGSPTR